MPRKNVGCPINRLYGVGDIFMVDCESLTSDGAMAHLESRNLDLEARSIWVAHPNLHVATNSLFEWISDQWPSREQGSTVCAGFLALEDAINQVRIGLAAKETDSKQVLVNFHKGLMAVADDLATYVAWGCKDGAGMFAWRPFEDGRLRDWVAKHGFESVAFSRLDRFDVIERDGIARKLQSHIASARDLGQLARSGF